MEKDHMTLAKEKYEKSLNKTELEYTDETDNKIESFELVLWAIMGLIVGSLITVITLYLTGEIQE